MSSDMSWRITVEQLEVLLHIGIYDQEKTAPQRVIVNAWIDVMAQVNPGSIDDTYSYEPIYRFVAESWPQKPHVELLETLAVELLDYIFRSDNRVTRAGVSLGKPDIFPGTTSVSVEATWSRDDFARFMQADQ